MGFATLSEPRRLLADVYFGNSKVAEVPLTVRPGLVRFEEPGKLVASIPDLADPAPLLAALQRDLPANNSLVCSNLKSDECGTISPQIVGVIFDEDRFRLDLFINPALLRPLSPVASGYLKDPDTRLSLVSSAGLTVSGASGTGTNYNVQNQTILALGNGRLRSDSSYSNHLGLIVDNFATEVDHRNLRYSAGMFWAPGIDMIGQRRIIGAGVTTQFDTRADKELIEGTPLYLFLDRPTRVDVLVDGRLLDSRAYQAGNNLIDTTALPAGAYSLLLRIHEPSGRVREERRFFARNAQVAPVGKPIYYAFAGLLANTRRNRPVSPSKTLFYQMGTAHRLNANLAIDASIIGTQRRSMLEAGGHFLSSTARVRVAGLASTRGDRGVLLQAGSAGRGPLSLNFDLRRIWSRDREPLIPLPLNGEDFQFEAPTRAQLGHGSFTQVSGSLGYRVGQGFAGLTGAYRRDGSGSSQYTIGPSISLPVLRRGGLQLNFQADAQHGRSGTAAFAGLRLLATSNGPSITGSAGYASLRSRSERSRSARRVGSIGGEWYHQAADRTEISAGLMAERTVEDSNIRGSGTLYSPHGNVRGDILHHFGDRSGTQFGVTLQTGLALGGRNAAFGGRDLQQSALIAAVEGQSGDAEFEVLVNDIPKGRISSGGRLPIYLPAYRAYRARLKPVAAAAVNYDAQAHEFTLFPGTVATMKWAVEQTITVFGQAVGSDGFPVAGARVETRHGMGESDSRGFFQVDVVAGGDILFTRPGAQQCRVSLTNAQSKAGYAALGKVVCR